MTLKGFYDYTEKELKTTLEKGTYCLKVRGAEVSEWSDGRPRLDVSTEVVGGPSGGKFGPRITWSLGDFDSTTKGGQPFHVDGVAEAKKLVSDIRTMRDGAEIVLSSPGEYDERMLKEIARQIVGDQFIAFVYEDGNGYAKVRGRLFPVSAPPKGFKGDEAQKAFSLDSV